MAIGVIWADIWNELIWDTTIWAQEEGADTTPVPFSFAAQTDVPLSSTITSAAITVQGINAPTAISVSNGFYDINGSGIFVNTAGTVNNGDTVRASHTSSANYSTGVNTTVTIGGVSGSFMSTTLAAPVEQASIVTPRSRTVIIRRFG